MALGQHLAHGYLTNTSPWTAHAPKRDHMDDFSAIHETEIIVHSHFAVHGSLRSRDLVHVYNVERTHHSPSKMDSVHVDGIRPQHDPFR